MGPTNDAGDPSDDMGNGPQGADTADDAAPAHDADSAALLDLDLRTTSEIAEAECARAGTHTPVPHASTTRDCRGTPVGISIDNMHDKLERVQSATDIANLLSTTYAARLYAADQSCLMDGSRTWQVRFNALEGLWLRSAGGDTCHPRLGPPRARTHGSRPVQRTLPRIGEHEYPPWTV